ncbi:hypothetical protein R5R35_004415 [Gryllus longicercus]|uniref:Uncharacterized protein n=1 Tax=Gryllus longicercus TaxID=2509291 RepID=A0AAN9VAR9_9ORTH
MDGTKRIAYCNDIDGLFFALGYPHIPSEWRLFIDSSTQSLKGVLLHIGNEQPSVPIVYGTGLKEDFDTMKLILELVNYELHAWSICCGLKVVAILTGVKQGFSKHQCFMCNWEGRKRELHYTDHKWKSRVIYQIGVDSIDHLPLVPASKIILLPLHIELGLVKNFIRALPKDSDAFKSLKSIFPKLTAAKIDAGVFNGPQIRKLTENSAFSGMLTPVERRAWDATKKVIEDFLGNKRADNYQNVVSEMIAAYKEMKVNMSLKIHFLHNHLDYFPKNLGDFSDEHGERFHQDIATIEQRYKGKSSCNMLSEYCWSICRDTTQEQHKRRCLRSTFSNV